jgi:hypothetical protein
LVALGFLRESDESLTRVVATSADGLSWDVATLDEVPVPVRVTVAGPGLVGGGREDDEWFVAFWHSVDGTEWVRVPHSADFEDADFYDLIEGGPGVVAMGWFWSEGDRSGAAIWTSEDGTTFERTAEVGVEAEIDPIGGLGRIGDRLVMAALSWEPRAISFWSSTNGTDWAETHSEVLEVPFGFRAMALAGNGSQVLVLVGMEDDPSILAWTTTDGLTWQRSEGETPAMGGLRTLSSGGPGWVALGSQPAGVWVSPDGVGWSQVADDGTLFPEGTRVIDVAPLGPNVVVVGSVTADDIERPAVWIWQPGS